MDNQTRKHYEMKYKGYFEESIWLFEKAIEYAKTKINEEEFDKEKQLN